MSSANLDPPAVPSADEIAQLKRLADGIIRTQGNRFIKELLRTKNIRIGVNKDDFARNLTEAIETGRLRLGEVDGWLKDVEGWGNQHVYLYNISSTLRKDLTRPKIRKRVQDAGLDEVWEAPTVLEFPDEPRLTSISCTDSMLRLVWQEASPGWTPVPDKDYTQEEGLDTFEYRAYRKVERRAITRFETRLGVGVEQGERKFEGLAALFIADPIQGYEHK